MAFDNSYDTTNPGSAVGNREQLLDMSTVLYPTLAPIRGLLPVQSATADLVEWTVDDLRDPRNQGVPEGSDVSSFDSQHSNLVRLQNRVQHFRDTFKVSKKQEVYESVTPVKVQQAEEKALKQVLLDEEKAIASGQGAVTDDGSGTGSQLRGLDKWISNSAQSDDVVDVPSDYRTPIASIHSAGDFTEADMAAILASIFNEVGEMQDLHLVADTALRNHIVDEFTRANGAASNVRYPNGDGSDIVYNVEMFRGPFGNVKIITANPKCMPDTVNHDYGYILDPNLLGWAEALSLGSSRLEDQGGGPRGYVDCMGTLICKGPKGLGKITAIA